MKCRAIRNEELSGVYEILLNGYDNEVNFYILLKSASLLGWYRHIIDETLWTRQVKNNNKLSL
jgi:hypothetical protein